jgi:transposase
MKHLTKFESSKIITLHDEGYSVRSVAEKVKISKSTVFKVIKRYKERQSLTRKTGSGRPPVLNNQHKRILSKIMDESPKFSTLKINSELSTRVTISTETLRRELNRQGFYAYSPLKRPLTVGDKIIRYLVFNYVSYVFCKYYFTDLTYLYMFFMSIN